MDDKFIGQLQQWIKPITEFIAKDDLYNLKDLSKVDSDELLNEHQKAVDYYGQVMTHMKNAYYVQSMLSRVKSTVQPDTPNGSRVIKSVNNYLSYTNNIVEALNCIDAKMYRILNMIERLK